MIEFCNKKRMLLGIISLGGLTLIVLIVESHWTKASGNHFHGKDNSSKPEHCWEQESYQIIKACHPCSKFEVASQTVEACIATHFKEIVKCEKSGVTERSCDKVKWIEEKKYWLFEIAMFILALLSYALVIVRQRALDRRTMQKIQKQLTDGLAS